MEPERADYHGEREREELSANLGEKRGKNRTLSKKPKECGTQEYHSRL